MNFILKDNGLEGINPSEINETEDTDKLQTEIDSINISIKNLSGKIDIIEGDIDTLETTTSSISSSLSSVNNSIETINAKIETLENKEDFSINNGSIHNATINNLEVTGDINFTKDFPGNIDNEKINTDELIAALGTLTSLKSTNIENNNKIKTKELEVTGTFTTTEKIITPSIETEDISINGNLDTESITIDNFNIKKSTLNTMGNTNMSLTKLSIKVDGIVIIKFTDSSIVIQPGSISSNNKNLYAAYIVNGIHNIYIENDVSATILIIGEATINSSTVLKSSIRKNADSNGQPNIENTVKVAVVDTLPTIGQRNVIYVVLGDVAYYCDGQYFYEMASKKRN